MISDLYHDFDDTRPLKNVRYWLRRALIGKTAEDVKNEPEFYRKLIQVLCKFVAEFIGTFFLVLFICGIQMVDVYSATELGVDDVNLISKGIIGGFVLAGLIYAFGGTSGCHLNPVVTFAFFLRGVFDIRFIVVYWAAQIAGAVSAAAVLLGMFGDIGNLGMTAPSTTNELAFGAEILITFILLTVILSTTEKAELLGPQSALAVGSVFGALLLFAWNTSGASANPFRSLGPAIVGNTGWNTIWIYIVGPIIGMLLAVIVQRIIAPARNLEAETYTARGSKKKGPSAADIGERRRKSVAEIENRRRQSRVDANELPV